MRETLDFASLDFGAGQATVYSSPSLNLYQRLIQYFTVGAAAGYELLDLVNFHRTIYPEVLSVVTCEELFEPEHGYGSPDGAAEISSCILQYEHSRQARFQRHYSNATVGFDETRVVAGLGAGSTGVMNCLVPAIRDCTPHHGDTPVIVVTLPQYSVYDGIVAAHGIRPEYLLTSKANGFLPTADEVERVLTKVSPIAILLTFPGNPVQTTYTGQGIEELRRIVALCQERAVFLIVDNVYQDTIWRKGIINPEVFCLTNRAEYLVKVSGLSKDRPGASGLRIGYYVGDARLRERFCYYASIQYNTPNSSSRCFFALDTLFRMLRFEGRVLTRGDLDIFGDGVAGWSRPLERNRLFDRLMAGRFADIYAARLAVIESAQSTAAASLVETAHTLGFEVATDGSIGNVLLLHADRQRFQGNCHELFVHLCKRAKTAVLPGNAFGLPLQRGDAWFRITTVHEDAATIAQRIVNCAAALD